MGIAQKQGKKQRKVHPNSLANLEKNVFQPGQSGNPGGRPKGVSLTAELNALLAEVKRGKVEARAVVEAIVREAKKGNVKAFTAIADRTEGKPIQPIKHEGEVNLVLDSRQVAQRMFDKLLARGISEDEAREALISLGVDERDIPTLQTA